MVFSWQAWQLDLPQRWNPIKLEGGFDAGYALLVDLHRPRLGVRWSTPRRRKFDAAAAVRKAMLDEVGRLAAEEARPFCPPGEWREGRLYVEPEPPGRDVWIAFSPTSGRLVQVIHHAHRRERILEQAILPNLRDAADLDPRPWSVFDLSCYVPRDLPLTTHKLNAGDLSLMFADRKRSLTIRQIAVASLALKQLPLEKWLVRQQQGERRHDCSLGEPAPIEIPSGRPGQATLTGFERQMRRRRRYFFMRGTSIQLTTMALHDADRDKLVITHGSDEDLVRAVAASAGWAAMTGSASV